MNVPPSPTPAGWFPDPLGRHQHRYFNGRTWTSDVADGGMRFVDPMGISPGPADQRRGNGIATAGMVCGILALLVAWIPFVVVIGMVLAVLALIFGIQGLSRSGEVGSGRGFAVAAIVTGAVAIILSVVGVILSFVVWDEVSAFVQPGSVEATVTECVSNDEEVRISGELTNTSSDTRDYTVFVTTESERSARSTRSAVRQVDDVAPGETAEWVVTTEPFGTPGECDAELDVQGPFPFGIEIDAISD